MLNIIVRKAFFSLIIIPFYSKLKVYEVFFKSASSDALFFTIILIRRTRDYGYFGGV